MALESMKKARENLTCAICLETYRDPKMLICFHYFCKSCLEALPPTTSSDDGGGGGGGASLLCPTCRQSTPLPDGVKGLNAAHHINHILEAHDSLENTLSMCSGITSENGDNTSSGYTSGYTSGGYGYDNNLSLQSDVTSQPGNVGRAQAVTSKTSFSHCSEHREKELELYCDTCTELICFQCTLKTHHGHRYDLVTEALERHKAEITTSLKPLDDKVVIIDRALTQLDAHRKEISVQHATIEANLHATIRRFHEALDIRKTELVAQLHQTAQGKLKDLTAQRDEMETAQIRLNTCLSVTRGVVQSGNHEEILKKKASMMNQAREQSTPFKPDFLKPRAKSDTVFSSSFDFVSTCKQYGLIHTSEIPDPSQSYAMGKGLEEATVNDKSNVILQVINFKGEPCMEIVTSLTCELISEMTDTSIRGTVVRREQSQCEISYQPTIKGKHQLKIMIAGQNIRGSPFPVTVKLPIAKLGTPIFSMDGMKGPCGIATTKTGELVVTELATKSAVIMSPSGVRRCTMVTHGCPFSVAVDAEGNIVVLDSYNCRLMKFSANKALLQRAGSKGSGELEFNDCKGIAFNTNNNRFYISDSQNHRIQVLNSDLSFHHTFGKKGNGKGQLKHPWAVACNSTGMVFVTEKENNRMQCFTADGTAVKIIKQLGPGRGDLNGPMAIAIDTKDNVYVSEINNNRISVFNSEGHYITSFGSKGDGLGEFNEPRGVAVDASGVVYVCDLKNNRVQLF